MPCSNGSLFGVPQLALPAPHVQPARVAGGQLQTEGAAGRHPHVQQRHRRVSPDRRAEICGGTPEAPSRHVTDSRGREGVRDRERGLQLQQNAPVYAYRPHVTTKAGQREEISMAE